MKSSGFEKLLDLMLDAELVGHYDRNNFSICLYDFGNDEKEIAALVTKIESITKKYKLHIHDNSNKFSNVSILDIDL